MRISHMMLHHKHCHGMGSFSLALNYYFLFRNQEDARLRLPVISIQEDTQIYPSFSDMAVAPSTCFQVFFSKAEMQVCDGKPGNEATSSYGRFQLC